jgi:hypothetical protein
MWPLPRRVRVEQKMPETCRVSWQNKNSGYLTHLVGYLYEDYHDARSLEHKVLKLFTISFSDLGPDKEVTHVTTKCYCECYYVS